MNCRIDLRTTLIGMAVALLIGGPVSHRALGTEAPPATAPAERPFADPGEQVLAADKAPQDAPLRARDSDTFFKLSNPRVERGPKPWPQLVVDYEKTHL